MILTVLWFKFSILSIPFILKNLNTKQRHPCSLFDTRIHVLEGVLVRIARTFVTSTMNEGLFELVSHIEPLILSLYFSCTYFLQSLVHTFYTFLLLTSFCLYMMSLLWNRKVLSKNVHTMCFISIGTPNFCLEIMVIIKIESHLW